VITINGNDLVWNGIVTFTDYSYFFTPSTTSSTWTWSSNYIYAYGDTTASTSSNSTTYNIHTGQTLDHWIDMGYLDERGVFTPSHVPEPLTPEQEALRSWLVAEEEWHHAERMRLASEAARERVRAREAAEAKAEALLLSVMPEDQKEPFQLNGYFEVIGSCGTIYRIHRGVAGNIQWLDRESREVAGSLCCHPPVHGDNWLPTPDVMLAQMLALVTDEVRFLSRANLMSGRLPQLTSSSAA
jgi:hypothetical protein